jgi:hypothetical protein
MRTKTLAIIVTGFVVSFACCFIAIAANDTPHNASNNMSCGSCHGETLLDSPFWGGSWTYDDLCLSCHTEPPGGRYTEKNAPFEKTHSDAGGNALAECRDCHNPHYQRQKVYKNTDASNLYLAKGKITSCEYTCPVCPQVIGTTTFTFSTITYKSGWEWNPPTNTKLAAKTGDYRGAILFPNIGKLGYNYPITAVGATTITVKGNAAAFFCPSQTYTCDPPFDPSNQFCCDNPDDSSCLSLQTYSCNLSSPTDFAVIYGQYIKDVIDISPDGSGNNKTVKFLDQVGPKSFADGDGTYDGVCEACHTETTYHRNDSSGDHTHYASTLCTICHKHINGFIHPGGGGPNCEDCHGHDDGWNGGSYYGTTKSHSTHTENDADDLKGPFIDCDACHDTNEFPYFNSGTDNNGDGRYDLSETNVCDNCHSPGGAFDGVQMAKNSWHEGVYASPTLRAGKEKWCATCHDNDPAFSRPFDPVVDIVDNPEAVYEGTWESLDLIDGKYGSDIQYHEAGDGSSTATWVLDIPQNGDYDVYAWWPANEVFTTNAPYTIHYNDGSETVRVNQQINGGQWNLLGTFSFAAGTSGSVVLSDDADAYVIADAIRVVNFDNYGFGVYAPNVIGDNNTYGFYVTGHKINCLDCHDASKNHIDHEHRTYKVTEVETEPNVIGIVVNPYCDSYRLKSIDGQPCMDIPRPGGDPVANWQDFALCFKCHNRNEVLGADSTDVSHTNFWDEFPVWYPVDCGLDSPTNSHYAHLAFDEDFCGGFQNTIHADSDWDGVIYADSAESCVTCHNVHGSPSKAMIRHGELISSYGTTDKVPSLNFAYRIPPQPPWATVTWRPDIPQEGTFGIYAWWSASSSNVTNAKYTIYYNGGSDSVEVNQQESEVSHWNLLGTYSFAAGTSGYVELSNENYDGTTEHRYIIADAMGWDTSGDGNPDIIIDDLDPGWSREGSWSRRPSGEAYPLGSGYYLSHYISFDPDPDATLQESVGGGIYFTGTGLGKSIEENGICNMCHIGYPGVVGFIRNPYLGPQVLMPNAEPNSVSNNGTGTTLLTVHILDHNDDVSTVVVDLSSIDGNSNQQMYDDGTNGDVTAGDNIYSYRVTVPDTVAAGDKSLLVTATDAQSNTGTNTTKLTITNPG